MRSQRRIAKTKSPVLAHASVSALKVTMLGFSPVWIMRRAHHTAAEGEPPLAHSWITEWKCALRDVRLQFWTMLVSWASAPSLSPCARHLMMTSAQSLALSDMSWVPGGFFAIGLA